MRKPALFFIFLFLLTACEKHFDDLVEVEYSDNHAVIVSVSVPDTFYVSENNSQLNVSVNVLTNDKTPDVTAVLKKGDFLLARINMSAATSGNDTLTYTGVFSVENTTIGFYTVYFYLNSQKAASSSVYLRGINHAPVVFLYSMPDSVEIGEEFLFSVFVTDEEGSDDIAGVYYNVFDPNGNIITNSQGISDFPLSDEGDTNDSGDEIADDQVYTMKLAFPTGVQTGRWRFEFFAIDRSREKSNVIIHYLTVKQ